MTERSVRLMGFREFLLESGMIQDLPPDYGIQTWMHENRAVYHKEHGAGEGERRLFSQAWQDYNALNTTNESE